MAWLVSGAVALVALLATLATLIAREQGRALRRIATSHGLQPDAGGFSGHIGGGRWTMSASSLGGLRFTLLPPFALPESLRVARRRPATEEPDPERGRVRVAVRPLFGDTVEICAGHPEFDDFVRITALGRDATPILAALDFEARDRVYVAVQIGAQVADGIVVAEVLDGGHQQQAVALLVDLVEVFRQTDGPVERLMRTVSRDPVPSARHTALQHLLRAVDPDRTWLTSLAADADAPGQIRFVAARALPEDDERRALLVLAAEGSRWGALAAAAVSCDPTHPAFEKDQPVLEPALLAGLDTAADPPVIEALGRIGSIGCVPAIREAARRYPGARQPLERAVVAIQARYPAESGQLALAASVGGELALDPAAGPGRTER